MLASAEGAAQPGRWAALLFLCIASTAVVLQLQIPGASGWSILQPLALAVFLSAAVHLPKQGRCIGKAPPGGCPTAAGWSVLAALAVLAALTVAWTAREMQQKESQVRRSLLVATLVLQLLVLVAVVAAAVRARRAASFRG